MPAAGVSSRRGGKRSRVGCGCGPQGSREESLRGSLGRGREGGEWRVRWAHARDARCGGQDGGSLTAAALRPFAQLAFHVLVATPGAANAVARLPPRCLGTAGTENACCDKRFSQEVKKDGVRGEQGAAEASRAGDTLHLCVVPVPERERMDGTGLGSMNGSWARSSLCEGRTESPGLEVKSLSGGMFPNVRGCKNVSAANVASVFGGRGRKRFAFVPGATKESRSRGSPYRGRGGSCAARTSDRATCGATLVHRTCRR